MTAVRVTRAGHMPGEVFATLSTTKHKHCVLFRLSHRHLHVFRSVTAHSSGQYPNMERGACPKRSVSSRPAPALDYVISHTLRGARALEQ
jgi:hypothetical protein